MNVPLTLVAFTLVYCFLDLRQPRGSLRQKLALMDWTYVFAALDGIPLLMPHQWKPYYHRRLKSLRRRAVEFANNPMGSNPLVHGHCWFLRFLLV